jgi:predicted acetyltransferase
VTGRGLEIRPLGPDDDIEAELDLRRRAFGPIVAADKPGWVTGLRASIDAGQLLGVFDGARPVASARYFTMRQWWHGRSMPMAGVAGVKVAPEERGRGVGRAMMTRLLAEMAERGYPVSVLYPSTLPVYRSLGWEIAGARYETVIPAHALTSLAAADPCLGQLAETSAPAETARPAESDLQLRSAGPGGSAGPGAAAPGLRRATASDAATVIETLGRVHQTLRDHGPNTREPAEAARWLDDEDHFAYLADDGFLSYRWADGHAELDVQFATASSAGTARAFWQIVASHASMAQSVRACLAPDDPVSWMIREPAAVTKVAEHWMLRVLDPPEAVAARGYPAAAAVTVGLELADPVRPANSGHWLLEVSGGAGKLAPVAGQSSGRALRLGARGFAALFAGVPVSTLRRAGLAAGGDQAADDALDCAFGGPAFMMDYF